MKPAARQSRSQLRGLTVVNPLRPRRSPAFSMVETLLCVVLVGGLLVVALDTAGSSVVAQQRTGHRARGRLLAQELMSEILVTPYEDPDQVPVWGLEGAENTGVRSAFDDVDDYADWSTRPPEDKSGNPHTGLSLWERSVRVNLVDPDDLNQPTGANLGVKRIIVTVTFNDAEVASLIAVRTNRGTISEASSQQSQQSQQSMQSMQSGQ